MNTKYSHFMSVSYCFIIIILECGAFLMCEVVPIRNFQPFLLSFIHVEIINSNHEK